MAILNEKNENTEKKIHLLVTTLCSRNCKHCCNKQYDLNEVPYVTDEELKNAEVIYITGGEPFQFSSPNDIAGYLKTKCRNIKKVIVYTNAKELSYYLMDDRGLFSIDGVTVSIKTKDDKFAFETFIVDNLNIECLTSNILYVFNGLTPIESGNFKVVERSWQEEFVPDPNSIFRKI